MFLLVIRVGLFRKKKKAIAKPEKTLEENMTKNKERIYELPFLLFWVY